jgi:thioesterase domain-containing protein/acyl carrier protein
VDKSSSLCPIGVPGELWVAGTGVTRGYLNNPELTFERFLSVSSRSHKSSKFYISKKIYRTGDLVRWLWDGSLEFLGRKDHQVKVRGFRVELGEIENQLRRMSSIKDAVVIAREGQTDEKYLCAYIVPGENNDMSHLRDELGKRLPGYMVPAFFVPLEELPLMPNGKVDRKALPEPDPQFRKNRFYHPPRNHIEKKLAELWAQVLFGSHKTGASLGIDDNFFAMGGNSLKMIQLISRVREIFNVEIPMSLVFKTPFLRNISAYLMEDKFKANEEEIVVLLGPEKIRSEKIFCFPPAVGYGIAYMGLAPLLSSYSIYAFNYIDDEDKDKMEKYVETIIEIQPKGAYILLGYSAGGRLCLKAAELLEKQGYQVRDIILLDCYSQRKSVLVEVKEERIREFNDQLKQGLKELGLEHMTDNVMERMEKYGQYHDLLQAREPVPIHANIHLIKAEDKQGQEGFIGWEAFTQGEYHEYEGFGIHKEMLYPDFIEQNADVINNILTPAPHDAKPISKKLLHHTLSACNVKFLEFVGRNPEALIGSNYREMIEKLGGDVLQPWPTFIDQPARKTMEKTALTTINLIRSIPKRIFNNDPYLMSRYYLLPVKMIEIQLNGVTDEFLNTLIGRGDFVLTSSGYKCLEFNIAANIGGLHLPIWAVPYFENPIILRFLKENHVKIKDRDVIDIFLEHLVFTAQETLTITDNHLNIAMVTQDKGTAPGESNEPNEIEIALNLRYEKTLHQLNKKLQGRVILCDFDDLAVRGDGLYHKDQPVHILVESYEGAVPPEILHLFKTRRICLFNGPVTGLMSNKLNLALLSEHED